AVLVSVTNANAELPGELLVIERSATEYPPTVPKKPIELPPRIAVNPAPQFAALNAIDVLQLKMVTPFCNDRNASAFAVGLTATSNVVDPKTVTSVLFICAAMA